MCRSVSNGSPRVHVLVALSPMEGKHAVGFGFASQAGSRTKMGGLALNSQMISVVLQSELATAWLMYSCALWICVSGSCVLCDTSTWSRTCSVVLKGSSGLASVISRGSGDERQLANHHRSQFDQIW